jgi:hypothetical protein
MEVLPQRIQCHVRREQRGCRQAVLRILQDLAEEQRQTAEIGIRGLAASLGEGEVKGIFWETMPKAIR